MLVIRRFRRGSDEEAYVRIYNAGFSDYDDNRTVTLAEVRKVEEAPTYNLDGVLLAELDEQIVGMVNAQADKLREDKKGFIQSLSVLPEFRRRGIGKRLLSEAMTSLRKKGMKIASTWAQTDRLACVHLYESFGFKCIRSTSLMTASLAVNSERKESEVATLKEADLTNNEHVVSVCRLDNEAFKEHFNYRPITIEETRYMLFDMPWYQHVKVWFAMIGAEPVGYVIAGIDVGLNEEKHVKNGWINDIGVLKQHRRKYVGTSLIQQAMRYLRTKGMETALLYVDDQNPTQALKLYETVGFIVKHKNNVYEQALT